MYRGDVDDTAELARCHERQGVVHGVEGSRQVDGDDGVPGRRIGIGDRNRLLHTGIVDQHIERAPCLHRLDELADRLGIAKVAIEKLRFRRTGGGDFILRCPCLCLACKPVNGDACAGSRQAFCHGKADALHRSGYQRGLSRKMSAHAFSPDCSAIFLNSVFKTLP